MNHNSAQDTQPRFIAHRGVPATHPENTICGLRAAVEHGAKYVEFDVQMSADGAAVLSHDESLVRAAGIEALVMDLNLEQLRTVDVGMASRFGDAFRGTPLPTLDEAVAFIAGTDSIELFFVDVKDASIERFGEQFILGRILESLRDERSRAVMTCQNMEFLRLARQRGLPTAWVATSLDESAKALAERFQPEYIFSPLEEVPNAGEKLWPGPWKWAIYGVENIENAMFVAERGAHFIETKTIGTMLADPRAAQLSVSVR